MLPGLQQTGRAMVETKRLATLVDELQLDPDGRHRLIIDAPGMEAEIVDQLIADDLASIFTAVDVTAGREPLVPGQPAPASADRTAGGGRLRTRRRRHRKRPRLAARHIPLQPPRG